MTSRFVQIHTLTHYSASLLNRDDAGFAKRMPFGGAVRTRISSQCLKRHWRMYDGDNSLRTIDAPDSVRSRVAFERYVVVPLTEEGVPLAVARAAAQKLADIVLGSEAKREKAQRKGGKKKAEKVNATEPNADPVMTSQLTVLGRPELEYLCKVAREAIAAVGAVADKVEQAVDDRIEQEKDFRKNIQALQPGSLEAGLGAALFGRMVTGDILSRTDAAVHVAHAMTVHGQMAETDYFTAIDDLLREEGEQGSGHINASELTSGLFYGYVVLDLEGLVRNLGDNRDLAADVAHRFIHIASTVSPGAKKGSTAPYAYSHLVLVESGRAQPRTLQNAFIDPVRPSGDLVQNAYLALERHLSELDAMYGRSEQRAHAGLSTGELFEGKRSLSELADWTKAQVLA